MQDAAVCFLRIEQRGAADPQIRIAEQRACRLESGRPSSRAGSLSWSSCGRLFAVLCDERAVALFRAGRPGGDMLACELWCTLRATDWPKNVVELCGLHFIPGPSPVLLLTSTAGQLIQIPLGEIDANPNPSPAAIVKQARISAPVKGCAGGVQCSALAAGEQVLLHLACRLDAKHTGVLSLRLAGPMQESYLPAGRVALSSGAVPTPAAKRSAGLRGFVRSMFAADAPSSTGRTSLAASPDGRRLAVVYSDGLKQELHWVEQDGSSRCVALPEGTIGSVAWWSAELVLVATEHGEFFSVNREMEVVKQASVENVVSFSRGDSPEARICYIQCESGWCETPPGRKAVVTHGRHALCRSYAFSVLQENSPEVFVKRKIAEGDKVTAVLIAKEQGLDPELVNKWLWESSAKKDGGTWKEFGSQVKDKEWVVAQALQYTLPTLADMQLLLDDAASEENANVDLAELMDKWRTYVSIFGSAEYSPAGFQAFKTTHPMQLARSFAEEGKVDAVRVMLRRHGNQPGFALAAEILPLLDCFPDSLSPAAYEDLLPCASAEAFTGDYLVLADDNFVPFPSLHEDNTSSLSFSQLCSWYAARARAFDTNSGMLFHAHQLTTLALRRLQPDGSASEETSFTDLVQLQEDSWMLASLVYEQQTSTLMTLEEWQATGLTNRVAALCHDVSPSTAVDRLVKRLVPAYGHLPTNSLVTLSWLKALRAHLVSLCRDEASNGIEICAALIQQSRPVKEEEGGTPRAKRVIPSTQVLIETALACCYASARVDDAALEAMEEIFESLPVRLPALEKRLPALARLQDRVELLETHISADICLAKYEAAVPLEYFVDARRSQEEAELEELQEAKVDEDEEDAPGVEQLSRALMQRRDSRMGDPDLEEDKGKALLLRMFRGATNERLGLTMLEDALLVRSLVFPYLPESYVYKRALLALLRGFAFDAADDLLQREETQILLGQAEIEEAVCTVFDELFNSAADASQMEVAFAQRALDILPFAPSARVQTAQALLRAVAMLHSELQAPMVPLQVKKLLAQDPLAVLDELFRVNPVAFRPQQGAGLSAVGAKVLRLADHLGLRSPRDKLAVNARLIQASVAAGDAAAALAVAGRMEEIEAPLPEACLDAFLCIAESSLFDAQSRVAFCSRCVDACQPTQIGRVLQVMRKLPSLPDEVGEGWVKEPVPEVDITVALEDDLTAVDCALRLLSSLPLLAVVLLGRVLEANASDGSFIERVRALVKERQDAARGDKRQEELCWKVPLYACAVALFNDVGVTDASAEAVCARVESEAGTGEGALWTMAIEMAKAAQRVAERGGLESLLGTAGTTEQFDRDETYREEVLRDAAVAMFERGALEKEEEVQTLLRTAASCQVDLFHIAADWTEAQLVAGQDAKAVVDGAAKKAKALGAVLRSQPERFLLECCPQLWKALPGHRKDLLYHTCNLVIPFLKLSPSVDLKKSDFVKTREALKRLHTLAPELDAKRLLCNPFSKQMPAHMEAVKEVVATADEQSILPITTLLVNRAASITPGLDESELLSQFILERPSRAGLKKLMAKLNEGDTVRVCQQVAFDQSDSALPLEAALQIVKEGTKLAGHALRPLAGLLAARKVASEGGAEELAAALTDTEGEVGGMESCLLDYVVSEQASLEVALSVMDPLRSMETEGINIFAPEQIYTAALDRCLEKGDEGALSRIVQDHLPHLSSKSPQVHLLNLCQDLEGYHGSKALALKLLESAGLLEDQKLMAFHEAMTVVTSLWEDPSLRSQTLSILEPSAEQAALLDRLFDGAVSAEQHEALVDLLLKWDVEAEEPMSISALASWYSDYLVGSILDGTLPCEPSGRSTHTTPMHARWHRLLLSYPGPALSSSTLVDRLPANALTEEESLEVLNALSDKAVAIQLGLRSVFASVRRQAREMLKPLAKTSSLSTALALAVQSCCEPSFLLKIGHAAFPSLQPPSKAQHFTWSFLYVEAALVCEGHVLAAGRVALQRRQVTARLWSAFSPIACLDDDLKQSLVEADKVHGERAEELVARALEVLSEATSTKHVVGSPTVQMDWQSQEEIVEKANGHEVGEGDEGGWEDESELEVSSRDDELVVQKDERGIPAEDTAWDAESELDLSSHSDAAEKIEEDVEVMEQGEMVARESELGDTEPTEDIVGKNETGEDGVGEDAWDSELVFSDQDASGNEIGIDHPEKVGNDGEVTTTKAGDGWGSGSDFDVDTHSSDGVQSTEAPISDILDASEDAETDARLDQASAQLGEVPAGTDLAVVREDESIDQAQEAEDMEARPIQCTVEPENSHSGPDMGPEAHVEVTGENVEGLTGSGNGWDSDTSLGIDDASSLSEAAPDSSTIAVEPGVHPEETEAATNDTLEKGEDEVESAKEGASIHSTSQEAADSTALGSAKGGEVPAQGSSAHINAAGLEYSGDQGVDDTMRLVNPTLHAADLIEPRVADDGASVTLSLSSEREKDSGSVIASSIVAVCGDEAQEDAALEELVHAPVNLEGGAELSDAEGGTASEAVKVAEVLEPSDSVSDVKPSIEENVTPVAEESFGKSEGYRTITSTSLEAGQDDRSEVNDETTGLEEVYAESLEPTLYADNHDAHIATALDGDTSGENVDEVASVEEVVPDIAQSRPEIGSLTEENLHNPCSASVEAEATNPGIEDAVQKQSPVAKGGTGTSNARVNDVLFGQAGDENKHPYSGEETGNVETAEDTVQGETPSNAEDSSEKLASANVDDFFAALSSVNAAGANTPSVTAPSNELSQTVTNESRGQGRFIRLCW